jgi:hypothetical protein
VRRENAADARALAGAQRNIHEDNVSRKGRCVGCVCEAHMVQAGAGVVGRLASVGKLFMKGPVE